ncbi:hypothetical protein [Prosthecobacter sp.]|uniref:hypothetical protein n=1 Tax=Prosthecobacter sp. TaxID=1965333 RepID=UPI0037837772
MSSQSTNQSNDDLRPEIRKALVEIGAVIPTTVSQVSLAERHMDCQVSQSQIDASFAQIEQMLTWQSSAKTAVPVMRYTTDAASFTGLALAARNGSEIDEATRSKIEADIADANRKQRGQ